MKILHTSDWHLGQQFYNFDREEEHKAMLDSIIDVVSDEQPDVFLLSGDVFHTAQPSASAMRLLTDTLLAIRDAAPDMPIVITAGNHDSASRHDVFRNAWNKLNVHTVGSAPRDIDKLDNLIFRFPGKCVVAAVPYFPERFMPEDYFQRVAECAARLNPDGLPMILMAHTTVGGSDFTGHSDSSEKYVGGIAAVEPEMLLQSFDYVALGHIHRPQFIPGFDKRIRYSGTPLSVSFDENFPHSVTLVEISTHGELPSCREIVIAPKRPLVSIPTSGYAPFEECLQLLEDFDQDIPAYIRLNVAPVPPLPPFAAAKATAVTEGKRCDFCAINIGKKESDRHFDHSLSIQRLKETSPLDLARRFAGDTGNEFSDEMESLLKEALNLLEADERELS